jgi:hypothetical protein
MPLQKVLYVDEEVVKDRSYLIQNNPSKVFFNLKQISEDYLENVKEKLAENNNAYRMIVAGRYLCWFKMSLDTKECDMAFFNVPAAPDYIHIVANAFKTEQEKERYYECVQVLSETPECYSDFVIKVGEEPKE